MSEQALFPANYVPKVNEAVQCIRTAMPGFQPLFALTLGSGFNVIVKQFEVICRILYDDLPGFRRPTVERHVGEMIFCEVNGMPIIVLSGRTHFYEVADVPYGILQVVFPVHVMASLGAKAYIATNAAGGLDPSFQKGDLMVIADHLDVWMPDPTAGYRPDFGDNRPVFQWQTDIYDPGIVKVFLAAASEAGEIDHVHAGIYTARTGRTYEASAVSRMLRKAGADAVGMSTTPEIITAFNRGMLTGGISCITNVIGNEGHNKTSHGEVVDTLDDPIVQARIVAVLTKSFGLFPDAKIF